MLHLFATLLINAAFAPDARGTPTTDYGPPPRYTIRTVNVYKKLNSTGTTLRFGGNNPGYGTPSPTYVLTRKISCDQDSKGGWGEPPWTADFDPVGDFSVTKTAVPDPNEVTDVPDGSTYYHDVYIKNVLGHQSFSGYDGVDHEVQYFRQKYT